MERIRNFISPRTRRKKYDLGNGTNSSGVPFTGSSTKIFGVSLQELMSRAPPHALVPPIVVKLCEYIYRFGLDNVGLFRVSGSVRVVEKMRMKFELTGDVDLEEENDVAATAGLLKVFLRDLPDTLIPAKLTPSFFSVVLDTNLSKEEKIQSLKRALNWLPEENYNLLQYISSLLVVVAENEEDNKMSAYTLAILFGPNVFTYELTSGMEGMKDMDTSKDVMKLFISEFNALFKEDGDPEPKDFWANCNKKKSPPVRPPPPKFLSMTQPPQVMSDESLASTSPPSTSNDFRPVPSPRKMKNVLDSPTYANEDSVQSTTCPQPHGFIPLFSPREEVDQNRSHSPFALESDTHSMIDSPLVTSRTCEYVEKAIVETISEHIFGALELNQNSNQHSPELSRRKSENLDFVDGTYKEIPVIKPRTSIGTRYSTDSTNYPLPEVHVMQDEDMINTNQLTVFEELNSTELLPGVKKPLGPPRRSPSRKHRRSWEGAEIDATSSAFTTEKAIASNESFQTQPSEFTNGLFINGRGLTNEEEESEEEEEEEDSLNENVDPVMVRGENVTTPSECLSPSVRTYADVVNGHLAPLSQYSKVPVTTAGKESPTRELKLFIPPLDFSTLHEHMDGGDAISLAHDQTSVIKKAELVMAVEQNAPIVSPRSDKLKKRNGSGLQMSVPVDSVLVIEAPMSPSAYSGSGPFRLSLNTDIPPSPPISQDLYKKHCDDECSLKLRQLTKKIQGLKKKIKAFEESFEREHGYKPTQGEKSVQPEIKKHMNELSKARKDLKRLKENTEKSNRSRHSTGASSSGNELSPPATPSVGSTLEFIQKCLKEKRQEASRPEEVMLMSRDQVQEEKLAVQRALLHFEGLHGRPSSREEKDLMRPLYDRYRSIKRILAKPVSPRNSLELQTVPEEQIMEIPRTFNRAPIHVPTAHAYNDQGDNNQTPELGTTDFGIVTRDFGGLSKSSFVLRDIDLPPTRWTEENIKSAWPEEKESGDDNGDAHLHELTLPELHVEIESSRKEKKRLRRVLREFEEDFLIQHGRKVQKEDRYPLQTEYSEYKKVKARMRLLEALVLKHQE